MLSGGKFFGLHRPFLLTVHGNFLFTLKISLFKKRSYRSYIFVAGYWSHYNLLCGNCTNDQFCLKKIFQTKRVCIQLIKIGQKCPPVKYRKNILEMIAKLL